MHSRSECAIFPGKGRAVAVTISILLTALLSGDPTATPKPAKPKVYVVYVTVVEVDSDGNETVLFTPKVQTTGNPAGVTVDHADGRSFEFNCQLAAAVSPSLEAPPTAITTLPVSKESQPVSAAEILPQSKNPGLLKPAAPARKPDEHFVRTYDVSDLLESTDKLTAAEFEPLMQTLKAVALPESWAGKATIRPFASTKSLVIKQTEAGHKAVAAALEELRPRVVEQDKQEAKNSPVQPSPK